MTAWAISIRGLQRLVVVRMPWSRFFVRGLLGSAIASVPVLYATSRWSIAVDPQLRRCLPDARGLLIDGQSREPVRGGIAVFRADPGRQRLFAPGALVGKVVVGLPGDQVVVGPDTTQVNGRIVGHGLLVAATLGEPEASFVRTLVVPADHVFLMGATVDSYDSRYWGPLPTAELKGTARVLF